MSWIVAGIATVAKIASNSRANEAEREANALAKHQDQIDVERFKGDVALEEYNMRLGLAQLESDQVAMSSAMGKQVGEGSVANIQDVGRKDLEENVTRMQDEVSRAERYGSVSDSARDSALKSRTSQRRNETVTSGLLSFSKAFA